MTALPDNNLFHNPHGVPSGIDKPTASDDLAAQYIPDIEKALAAITDAIKDKIEAAIAAGENLKLAKDAGVHGEWADWIKDNFSLSERTAQRYMNYYANRKTIRDHIATLPDNSEDENRHAVADLSFRQVDELIKKPRRVKTPATPEASEAPDQPDPDDPSEGPAKSEGDKAMPDLPPFVPAGEPCVVAMMTSLQPPDVAITSRMRYVEAVTNWRRHDADAAKAAIKDMIEQLTALLADPD